MRGRVFRFQPSFLLLVGMLIVGMSLVAISRVSAAATITFVQAANREVTSGSTNSQAFSKANTAGNLIVAYVIWSNTAPITVTDSRGNTYAPATAATTWHSGQWSAQIWYAKNIASGTNTVTAKFATGIQSGGFGILYTNEYAGADKTAPLDVAVSAIGTSGAMSSGSATTTSPNDLVFGAGASDRTVYAAGTGFTTRSTAQGNLTEDKMVTAGSYNATATQSGQSWIMQMAAFKAAAPAVDTTPPSTPSGLNATTISTSQVNLSWNASTDNVAVTGYAIYRNGNKVGTSATTSYQDTGLSAGTSYSYTVTAFDAAGNTSAQSSLVTATTQTPDTVAPSVPTNLTADAVSTSQINLSWTASTDAVGVAGYKIYQNGSAITTVNGNSFQSNNLKPGTTYSFTVSAFDAAGNESAQSASVSATTQQTPPPDTQAPTTPTNVSANATSATGIDLTWDAATDNVGVTGYNVYRNGVKISSTTTPNYSDTGLTGSTTYAYTISAYDAASNESAQSASVSATTSVATGFPWPTAVSANKRYLVDQNGKPFMLVGDSPHSLVSNLSTSDMDYYFSTRHGQGINAAWVQVLNGTYTKGRNDLSTYDGILPFTTPYDIRTPNDAYFQRLDHAVASAQANGITLFLDPVDLAGLGSLLSDAGTTGSYNFGYYLGMRYKSYPNIVWFNGNDFDWTGSGEPYALALAQGLRAADPGHMQTVEFNYYVSGSQDSPDWKSQIDLDGAYTYFPTYNEVLKEYNRGGMPVYMQEGSYEDEHYYAGPYTLRHQEYWTMLSGGIGQLYGHGNIYPFASGWQNYMNTTGIKELQYGTQLFAGRQWQNLVPDQSHSLVTAGYGTFDNCVDITTCSDHLNTNDYLTAALTPDAALGMAYMPTPRTITVDMSKLSGAVTAKWYDPTTGNYTTISGSPFANSGLRDFTPPATKHADGQGDWILVLEATGGTVDTQAPSTPANVAASNIGPSQLTLNWTNSTDNVGVSGYNVYRNGSLVGTSVGTTYTDTALSANTAYAYTIAAVDYSGNVSSQSTALSVTTLNQPVGVATFIQVNSSTPQTPQTSVATNFVSAQAGGNLNAVVIGWYDTTSSVRSVTDSAGNTYQIAAPTYRGNGFSQVIYYAKNIASAVAGNVVTVTFDQPANYPDVRIAEYAGLDKTNPVESYSSATGTAQMSDSGTVNTVSSNILLLGAGTTHNAYSGAGNGFTARVITSPDADILEDRVVSAIGMYSASAPQYSADAWVMQVVAFKIAN